jgi:hypothetical protein
MRRWGIGDGERTCARVLGEGLRVGAMERHGVGLERDHMVSRSLRFERWLRVAPVRLIA